MAWAETHNNGQDIYLRRWDGAAWTPLGNSATGGGVSQTPGASQLATLAIGAGGTPLVELLVPKGATSVDVIRVDQQGQASVVKRPVER